MRRTKIVCTIGPATSSPEVIVGLIRAGMNVARLNFSHGTHEEHGAVIDLVRSAATELGAYVAVLQDLQGPKIRIGKLQASPTRLAIGSRVAITTQQIDGTSTLLSTPFQELPQDVHLGDRLLLSDGLVELVVESVGTDEVVTRVLRGGLIGERSGLNLPGVEIRAPSLTDKDVDDLRFGLSRGVDYVAVSFVRRPEDVVAAKRIISQAGADVPVVAKLEKPEAIRNLEAILEVSDVAMVARGDLGVEVRPERVPMLQKEIIARANRLGIPVITATQMLESMTHHEQPTRAEASDVANAILDGTDAVMLSGETAIGDYPLETVAMMGRIAVEAEKGLGVYRVVEKPVAPLGSYPHSIAESAVTAAQMVGAKAIIAFTQSGFTGRLISKYRPGVPIVAVTGSEQVARRMSLYWGVVPQVVEQPGSTDEMREKVEAAAAQLGIVAPGDSVVVTASSATAPVSGTTNLMQIDRV